MNKKLTLSLVLTAEAIERMVADALMLNMAILTAFVGRLLTVVYLESQAIVHADSLPGLINESLYDYVHSAWLLILISLSLFWCFGFYTHGRAYRGRYKALIVFQAVTLAYLLFALAAGLPFQTLATALERLENRRDGGGAPGHVSPLGPLAWDDHVRGAIRRGGRLPLWTVARIAPYPADHDADVADQAERHRRASL